jgi:hypothetical protein
MNQRSVTTGTQVKIINYLLYASKAEQAFIDEQAKAIIETLPESIKNDLIEETHHNIIKNWSIFNDNFSNEVIESMKDVIQEVRI